jgi:hypothetical protein
VTARSRDERGTGAIAAVAYTIVIIAAFRWIGLDIIGYISDAADWLLETVVDLLHALFGEESTRRSRE